MKRARGRKAAEAVPVAVAATAGATAAGEAGVTAADATSASQNRRATSVWQAVCPATIRQTGAAEPRGRLHGKLAQSTRKTQGTTEAAQARGRALAQTRRKA